jgi:hypothetical protein
VTLPTGETVTIGHGSLGADVEVTDYSAVADILRTGLTGFAEAHMDGRIETFPPFSAGASPTKLPGSSTP